MYLVQTLELTQEQDLALLQTLELTRELDLDLLQTLDLRQTHLTPPLSRHQDQSQGLRSMLDALSPLSPP